PPTAWAASSAWRIASRSWPRDGSPSTPRGPRSRSRTSSVSTPCTRRATDDPLRPSGPRRVVEGSRHRAPLPGDPQRAGLLLAVAALHLSVLAGGRPRAPGGRPARRPVARLLAERPPGPRPILPGGTGQRLLGGPAPRARRQVGHLPGQARG